MIINALGQARLRSASGRASDLFPLYPGGRRFKTTVRQEPMLVDPISVVKKTTLNSTTCEKILYYKREMTTLNKQSNKSAYR